MEDQTTKISCGEWSWHTFLKRKEDWIGIAIRTAALEGTMPAGKKKRKEETKEKGIRELMKDLGQKQLVTTVANRFCRSVHLSTELDRIVTIISRGLTSTPYAVE